VYESFTLAKMMTAKVAEEEDSSLLAPKREISSPSKNILSDLFFTLKVMHSPSVKSTWE
jgi:hypothetical protein